MGKFQKRTLFGGKYEKIFSFRRRTRREERVEEVDKKVRNHEWVFFRTIKKARSEINDDMMDVVIWGVSSLLEDKEDENDGLTKWTKKLCHHERVFFRTIKEKYEVAATITWWTWWLEAYLLLWKTNKTTRKGWRSWKQCCETPRSLLQEKQWKARSDRNDDMLEAVIWGVSSHLEDKQDQKKGLKKLTRMLRNCEGVFFRAINKKHEVKVTITRWTWRFEVYLLLWKTHKTRRKCWRSWQKRNHEGVFFRKINEKHEVIVTMTCWKQWLEVYLLIQKTKKTRRNDWRSWRKYCGITKECSSGRSMKSNDDMMDMVIWGISSLLEDKQDQNKWLKNLIITLLNHDGDFFRTINKKHEMTVTMIWWTWWFQMYLLYWKTSKTRGKRWRNWRKYCGITKESSSGQSTKSTKWK